MNLADDDFTLFGLQPRFAQDAAEIDARWKALQRQAHPDRFVGAGDAAQRLALQWSARLNEARQRLRDPLRRAALLCQLRGVSVDAERSTRMPADFLQEQMAWREALEEAGSPDVLQELARRIDAARATRLARLGQLLDEVGDTQAAAAELQALMFIDRLTHDLSARMHAPAGT